MRFLYFWPPLLRKIVGIIVILTRQPVKVLVLVLGMRILGVVGVKKQDAGIFGLRNLVCRLIMKVMLLIS
ncbi:MAG: hypothetical protein CO092_04675 [Candidatus Aenigmarchaeota archaeon CG_4_9_14_3_um_filter_37_18]|nr:MAG: hypothetical protein CO092_04675 [Candidatus Aenigmarchaeota archaeon CG_4_9_14_3_um_filter_37_18]